MRPTPIFNEKVLCGLGRSIASTGSLGAVSVERALEACRRFRAIAGRLGVKTLLPFATAAVRDATNGPDFKAQAEEILGSPIEILTGEREAQLAANGIIMGFDEADGIAGDLGGGSLELVDIAGRRRTRAMTLPLGGLRLLDTTSGKMPEALKLVEAQLDAVPWLVNNSGRRRFTLWAGRGERLPNCIWPMRSIRSGSCRAIACRRKR